MGMLPFPSDPSYMFYVPLIYRLYAPAPPNANPSSEEEGISGVLGLVPHQLRGFLGQFRTIPLVGAAYNKCTGCSETVRSFPFFPFYPDILSDITSISVLHPTGSQSIRDTRIFYAPRSIQ